jgi:hypothetical protein
VQRSVERNADEITFLLRTPVFALGAALRGDVDTFVLRTPVFALGAALRADVDTFVLRTPVFALGAALRAHRCFTSSGIGKNVGCR